MFLLGKFCFSSMKVDDLVSVIRRRLASACAEDPGIASWGDRWRMTMMIVSISVCSGHIQLSTTTVYLEGSRFDI